jgi:hypothetical protein
MKKYVLMNKMPVLCDDILEWSKNYEQNRIIKQEYILNIFISTIFLGLDHNFFNNGPPILWETMVFGGKLNGEQDRCSGSWEQAEKMHSEMVIKVKQFLNRWQHKKLRLKKVNRAGP